ncbi:hypothetical protein [Actinophytocola glycyrrhizae]|uniref:Uncharacterized protein n=1 Tax=Actinophytocola glycyrrhizae TaxID=2044873 RepID=A0ABV9S2B1_9PSEU
MSVLLFLNELSCATNTPAREVGQAMTEFVEVVRKIRRIRQDIALVTHVRFNSIQLADDFYISQWISAEPANRDRWRFIRAIENRAPFRSVTPDGSGYLEYRHDDRPAEGLGGAHLLDSVALSLPVAEPWNHASIVITRSTLTEDDSGDLAVVDDEVFVRHIATAEHADQHHGWLQHEGQHKLRSCRAIWENRGEFFPHLTFLPRVKADFDACGQDWVHPIAKLLSSMERAVANWSPNNAASPEWQTKVTGESMSRQELCRFTDIDGMPRVFGLHGRFTPGPGRIYFRLVPENGTARIAYIGRKLGA